MYAKEKSVIAVDAKQSILISSFLFSLIYTHAHASCCFPAAHRFHSTVPYDYLQCVIGWGLISQYS